MSKVTSVSRPTNVSSEVVAQILDTVNILSFLYHFLRSINKNYHPSSAYDFFSSYSNMDLRYARFWIQENLHINPASVCSFLRSESYNPINLPRNVFKPNAITYELICTLLFHRYFIQYRAISLYTWNESVTSVLAMRHMTVTKRRTYAELFDLFFHAKLMLRALPIDQHSAPLPC